jgi:hypothetical protein
MVDPRRVSKDLAFYYKPATGQLSGLTKSCARTKSPPLVHHSSTQNSGVDTVSTRDTDKVESSSTVCLHWLLHDRLWMSMIPRFD